jgi:tetratricopeptide (TPR) repeat protein
MKLKRLNVILLSVLFFVTGYTQLFASEISDTLNSVQALLKEKNYHRAQRVLIDKLKTNQNSYKLWLALGYVYEADENFSKALKAFMLASELKTNIPGLTDRILRLQQIVKTQRNAKGQDKTSQSLFERARYQIAFGQKKEGFKTLYEAIEADRSLLSDDYGLIPQGMEYFKNNPDLITDSEFYLGAFQYYAGYYNQALNTLNKFIADAGTSPRQKDAKKIVEECQMILEQIKAQAKQLAQAKAAREAEKKDEDEAPQLVMTKEPGKTIPKPQAKKQVNYSSYDRKTPKPKRHENYAVTLARARVLELLSEFDNTSVKKQKLKIIWRLGDMRMPFPELMAKFASILNSEDSIIVMAALKAISRIGMPGAKICAPYIAPLIEEDNFYVKWTTIKILQDLPIVPETLVPALVKLYKEEKVTMKQNLIINAIFAYGVTGQNILRRMISEAPGPDKRPIAEILSILTGEDIEKIIRES